MPKISNSLLFTIFSALALTVLIFRAAMFPDVLVSPYNSAMNFMSGWLLGFGIAYRYALEDANA